MRRGPVDFMVAEFRDGTFHGQLTSALAKLVDQGLIRIIDLVFISRDAEGELSSFEIDSLDTDAAEFYAGLEGEFGGLLSDGDLEAAAAELEPGSAAGLIVCEHLWAREFAEALDQAGGTVAALVRIPADDVDRAFADLERV